MSEPRSDDLLRNVTREVLAELLPSLLQQNGVGNGNGHHAASAAGEPVPQVPAPPIAAVHRPPGWRPAPGQAPAETDPGAEAVSLASNHELNAFAARIARRCEDAGERAAIAEGRVRFRLQGAQATTSEPAPAAVMRIEKGAVTERTVREAAAAGARLVLAPRAVLTPMARDRARSMGVPIEKERRC
ncbi:MAG TPA: hypothetical protein VFQ71_08455 [Gaiellales bacterium]|nr:hypothetical protein [Gaiellales bacterium]